MARSVLIVGKVCGMWLKTNIGLGIDECACTTSHEMRLGMSVFVDGGEANGVCIHVDGIGRAPVEAQPHSSLCVIVQLSSPTLNNSAVSDRKHKVLTAWNSRFSLYRKSQCSITCIPSERRLSRLHTRILSVKLAHAQTTISHCLAGIIALPLPLRLVTRR